MTSGQTGLAPALVVMAAGIGSRYGGIKQIDPIGPNGEIIIDYSVYDALRAGFGKVIFVIRKDIEEAFREKIGREVEGRVDTEYVFQDINNVPVGFTVPADRKKPWGTGHAVLSCIDVIDRPFAAINADDFYGAGAFEVLAGYLQNASDRDGLYDYSMVGYTLSNTLSEHGSVSRGVCEVTPGGCLKEVVERVRIEKEGHGAKYTEDGEYWLSLTGDELVSMNFWGFTPSFVQELNDRFPRFLAENAGNILKAEFFLPSVVNTLLKEGKAQVKVLPTGEKWYGITNPADRASVQAALRGLVDQGLYPQNLWG